MCCLSCSVTFSLIYYSHNSQFAFRDNPYIIYKHQPLIQLLKKLSSDLVLTQVY